MARKKSVKRAKSQPVWTTEVEEKLLSRLMNGFSVADAIAGVMSRSTCYKRIREDEAWATRWQDAIETGNDSIRDEIARRGMRGVLEPVYHEGRVVGRRRKYSDNLLMFYAKSRMPEFKDNVHEHNHGFNTDGMAERLADKFASIAAAVRGTGDAEQPE